MRLQEGDWLFARNKDGQGNEMDDMIQVIVCKDPYAFLAVFGLKTQSSSQCSGGETRSPLEVG